MNPRRPIMSLSKGEPDSDADDLKSLSTYHFVGAGLAFLSGLYAMWHFAQMQSALNNPSLLQIQKHLPPEVLERVQRMDTGAMCVYLATELWLAALVILNILSGIYLRGRKHRTFSLVVAGMNGLQFPLVFWRVLTLNFLQVLLGTLLGVFTFVVFDRQSVRDLYKAEK